MNRIFWTVTIAKDWKWASDMLGGKDASAPPSHSGSSFAEPNPDLWHRVTLTHRPGKVWGEAYYRYRQTMERAKTQDIVETKLVFTVGHVRVLDDLIGVPPRAGGSQTASTASSSGEHQGFEITADFQPPEGHPERK